MLLLVNDLSDPGSASMKAAEDYLRRGRIFSKLSNEALLQEWNVARTAHTDDPLAQDRAALENDLTVECLLRKIKPPYCEENLTLFLSNLRIAVEGK
jgi:hypothetical protein